MATAQSLATSADLSAGDDQVRAREVSAKRRRREAARTALVRLISLAVVLTIWQIGGAQINPILFTTPIAVAKAAVTMIASGELIQYLWPSLVVLIYGLILAALFGISIGLALARFPLLDAAFDMYITFLYSTPTVALVPLIVLWAGFETTAKVIILFLFAFFPLVINTYQGVKNVDKKLLEVGKSFRCSERQLWVHIIIPAALPFIVTGLRLAVGRGLIGMVLADLYTAISGIGYLIVRTASTYQIDKMFVPVVTLGFLGVALTALLRVVEKRVAPWTAAGDRD
jgi:ABC-type nitrate/sulfonate/bicarbonate transport system permease component